MRRTLVSISFLTLLLAAVCWQAQLPPAAAWQQAKQDGAPVASWIWADKTIDNQIVVFRKPIDVPAKLKKATVTAACDNVMSLFVNAKKLADHMAWEQAFTEDITKELKEGKNLI